MKLAKLSLAAIVVAGLATSSFAADTLADAFKNGKVSGDLAAYYFNTQNSGNTAAKDADILDFAIDLNYVTGVFNGFSAGFTFQGVSAPFADGAIGIDGTGKNDFKGDMYSSGAVLSEAYLNYANSGFFVKAGRQYISTPIVASSGSRAIKQSYEAINFGYTGFKGTTIIAGVVTKYADRTNNAGSPGEFNKFSDDNAYHIFVNSKAIPNFDLTAQYVTVKYDAGDMDVVYGEAVYDMKLSGAAVKLGVQYKDSMDDQNAKDGDTLAFKVDAKMGALSALAAYSMNDKKSDTYSGLGGGSDNVYTAAPIAGGNYDKDATSLYFNVGYDFTSAINAYAIYQAVDTATDFSVYGGGASYKFDGALKGLKAMAQYEIKDKDGNSDNEKRFRFVANYSF